MSHRWNVLKYADHHSHSIYSSSTVSICPLLILKSQRPLMALAAPTLPRALRKASSKPSSLASAFWVQFWFIRLPANNGLFKFIHYVFSCPVTKPNHRWSIVRVPNWWIQHSVKAAVATMTTATERSCDNSDSSPGGRIWQKWCWWWLIALSSSQSNLSQSNLLRSCFDLNSWHKCVDEATLCW